MIVCHNSFVVSGTGGGVSTGVAGSGQSLLYWRGTLDTLPCPVGIENVTNISYSSMHYKEDLILVVVSYDIDKTYVYLSICAV